MGVGVGAGQRQHLGVLEMAGDDLQADRQALRC